MTPFRYQLLSYKGPYTRLNCPACGDRHKRTFTPYVDTQTGELLPDPYGRCDRESNCGYHHSPYYKTSSGLSYADEVYQQWKDDSSRRASSQHIHRNVYPQDRQKTRFLDGPILSVSNLPSADKPVYAISDEVFTQSLGHYERNQFARLLSNYLGVGVAHTLLSRFQVGTSSRWPGACVFWYIDEQGRKRGGQIKLFDQTFHTEKYTDRDGRKRSKTDWVHTAFAYRCDRNHQPRPDWLNAYLDERNEVQKSPCLFGLPQLLNAPADQPVAVCEAPKTAVLCTAYFPEMIWLAVGALSYLNADRLLAVRSRKIVLFPDLSKDGSAFGRWSRIADELRVQGYSITVSDYLEQRATDEERIQGLDLADYLLNQWNGYPPDWDTIAESKAAFANEQPWSQ